MKEIRDVIRYYITKVIEDGKVPLWIKYDKTFLKYFADQMKEGFPGTRRREIGFVNADLWANTTIDTLNITGTNDTLIWNTDNSTTATVTLGSDTILPRGF